MAIIGTLRNKMGGLLVAIIALAIVAFILMDMGGQGNGRVAPSTNLISVNGEQISNAEFSERLSQNENYLSQQLQGAPASEQQKQSIRLSTYNELLGERLRNETYNKLGLKVGEDEKSAMLFDEAFRHPSISSNFRGQNGTFDVEMFKQYLNTLDVPDQNYEPGEKRKQWMNFEKAIFQDQADQKYNTLISKSTIIPNWMAKSMYQTENTKTSIQYIYYPFKDIPTTDIEISDKDLNSYLSKHKEKYTTDPSVSLKYVVFPVNPSQEDLAEVKNWMTTKFSEWKNADYDSLFIMANSDTRWDQTYYTKSELPTKQFADSIFAASKGSYLGPYNTSKEYVAYKVVDKKSIPDSVKVRHLLLSGENLQNQEEVDQIFALRDSLMNLVDTLGLPLASLTAQFSADKSNSNKGGDLGWVKPGQMVVPFNNAIFYQMKVGDIKIVNTQFGIHLVEVYSWGSTSQGIKLATLNREILASEATSNQVYSEASLFAGNNPNKETFEASGKDLLIANNIGKQNSIINGLEGNARQLIKWAFNAKKGSVSEPKMVGQAFVVALLDAKNEKGKVDLESVRTLVEAEVIKLKKAKIIREKMTGSDLSSIASNIGKSIQNAENLSFLNTNLAGVGNEPLIIGLALGLNENQLSKPLTGNNGVFVVQKTKQVNAPEESQNSLDKYLNERSNIANRVQSKLFDAMKQAAKIEDHSLEFF